MRTIYIFILLTFAISQPIFSQNTLVGTLPGGMGVSPSGASTYTIPIIVPPGRAGMTPEIALVYNSQTNGNILGKGWGVSGFSAITRSNSTPYYNGYYDNIDFNNDELMLDGQHLIKVGTNEYRTEIETYSKIIVINGSNGNYFKVYRKNGTIAEYGNSLDSRQMYDASGNCTTEDPLAWHINEIYDRLGNNILFTYVQYCANGEIHPNEIIYTGTTEKNGAKATAGGTHIFFNYRKGISPEYQPIVYYEKSLQNYLSKNSWLLNSIRISNDSKVDKDYIIDYSESPNSVSEGYFINKITLSHPNDPDPGSTVLNSTVFNWNFYQPSYTFKTSYDRYDAFRSPNTNLISLDLYGTNSEIEALFYNKIENPSLPDDPIYVIKIGDNEIPVDGIRISMSAYDLNCDGDDEIIFTDNSGLKIYDYNKSTHLMDLIYSNPIQGKVMAGDFTGDNIADILLVTDQQAQVLVGSIGANGVPSYTLDSHTLSPITRDQIETVADFNGDGKMEILWRDFPNYNFKTYSFNSVDGFGNALASVYISPNTGGQSVKYADFNGDGKTDICYFNTVNTLPVKHTWFSFGDGFKDPGNTIESYIGTFQIVEDLNNDGRADFASLEFTGNSTSINLNFTQPDGITTLKASKSSNLPLTLNNPSIESFCTSDIDGNGIRDIIIAFSEEIALKTPHYHKLTVTKMVDESLGKDLVTSITDGHGVSTNIEYTRFGMVSDQVTDFPLSKFRNKDYVVAESYIAGDNNQKWNRTTYSYKTPIVHLTGKGFLGFKEVQSTSWQNNLINITRNELFITSFKNNKYYFHSYPSIISTWSMNNGVQSKLLSETVNTVDLKIATAGDLKYFPVVTSSITKKMENNVANSDKGIVIQNQKITDIDNYGNSLYYEIYMNEKSAETDLSNFSWKKSITNTFVSPDEINWIISLPLTILITNTHPKDEDNIPKVNSVLTTYKYIEENGKILLPPLIEYKRTLPGSNTNLQTENWYTYDTYGNITSETLKATLDATLTDRKTEYVYATDQGYEGRFLTKQTIKGEVDQVTSYTYDKLSGNLLTITDPSDKITANEYDKLGRLKKTIMADRTSNEITTDWSANCSIITPPADALYYTLSYKNLNGVNEQWHKLLSFYDKYNRLIRTVTLGLNGEYIYTDSQYDQVGRLSKVSEPYFSIVAPTQWTNFSYDDLSRTIDQTLPTGSIIHTVYDGLTTRVTNTATSQWKETTVNVLGAPKTVSDPAGGTIVYEYDPSLHAWVINSQGVPTKFEYDAAGNQTKEIDPDGGTTENTYNAFGELVSTKDARNNIHTFTYDNFGRIIRKKLMPDNETTEYTYENVKANNGFGQIKEINKLPSTKTTYTYDNLDRAITKSFEYDGMINTFAYGYSSTSGMLETYTFPSSYTITYLYNQNGYMQSIVNFAKGVELTLWTASAANARGQLTDYYLGNGLATHNTYNAYGLPATIVTKNPANTEIQNLTYNFNSLTGNLIQKWEKVGTGYLSESYGYDPILNERLTSWQVSGGTQYSAQYASNGNIQTKSDVTLPTTGLYTYGSSAGPHAVTGITNPTSGYLAAASNQSVTYTGFNKVKLINQQAGSLINELEITYGNDEERIKSFLFEYSDKTPNPLKTKYYFDDYEIELVPLQPTRYLHYIKAGSDLIAIVEIKNNIKTPYYILTDYQGNYNVITSSTGTKLETLAFDPWGRRRNPTNWSFTNVPTSFIFDRGYTGHEHLDKFGLINMNGRVYDPTLARFLSPDPLLQNPGNTQSHNRYSYCLNNPLKYTDPSGYIQKPVGWNDPVPWIPWYGGGGAGYANNNWYSQYKTEAQNYVMMGSRAFNNMYGPGASDIASNLISNPSTFNAWQQGLISIDQVRRNGGNSNLGPSAGLVGEPGKSVVENQYGRWEYNMKGVWVQTVNKTKVTTVSNSAGTDRFSNSEKISIGIAATSGSVEVTTVIIDKLSGVVKNTDIVNIGKSAGTKFAIIGVATTTYFAISDGHVTAGDGARILMCGVTFIPYVGWAYGLIDMGTLLVTGTSVTDRIGNYVDQKYLPDPTRP